MNQGFSMTLKLELDHDLETLLIHAPDSQGIAVEEYARNLIRKAVEPSPPARARVA